MTSEGRVEGRGIGAIDAELLAWFEPACAPAPVSLAPPPAQPEGSGVSLYLLSLAPRPALHNGSRAADEYGLRYLVTAWAETPGAAHDLLAKLLLEASGRPGVEIEAESPPLPLWAGLGVMPQPAFVLQVPFRQAREVARVKPVLHPLSVRTAGLAALRGVLLANDDQPVAGARISLPWVGRTVSTDDRGGFSLEGVPVAEGPQEFRVTARGRELTAVAEPGPSTGDFLIVRVDLLSEDQ